MLALLAALAFGIGFVLILIGVAPPARFSLIYLGLTLFALHFVFDLASPLRGRVGGSRRGGL